MDLVEEILEAFVFGQPRANLGEQILGDVDGSCLALFLEGEVLSDVQRSAFVAAAGGAAAAVGVGTEGGGQDRGGGGELLESPLQHAQDEAGVVGNVHGSCRTRANGFRA